MRRRNKTRVAAFSVLVFTASALMFAIHPIRLFVYLAEVLHGVSSCTLGPAIAAMSLMLVGRMGMALRLGRNARYAAVGNGVGAALMGACGQYVSERAVFYLTAALTLPALVTLLPLRRHAAAGDDPISTQPRKAADGTGSFRILADRRLLIFCGCAMLFTFGNAPLLMLISGTLTAKGSNPSLLIGACIVLPQIVVALASPAVGRFADRYGRRLAAHRRLRDVAVARGHFLDHIQLDAGDRGAGARRRRGSRIRHSRPARRERRGARSGSSISLSERSASPSASAAR